MVLPLGTQVLVELPRSTGLLEVLGVVTHCDTLADGIVALGIAFTGVASAVLRANVANLRAAEKAREQRPMM